MPHLHFDCYSGISGDMVLGALVDAGLPFRNLVHGLKGLSVKGYVLQSKQVVRSGVHATKVDVVIRHGRSAPLALRRIQRIIATSRMPARVKAQGLEVFRRLAKAEGSAHRVSPAAVRFHEVGVVDSLVDVIGGLLGCHLLEVDRVTSSSVNLGSGITDSRHGLLPVPGPAVAALSRGLPVYSAGPPRELTTPTGIALLSVLVDEYGPLPLMRPTTVGYGAGAADTNGWPNALRVFIGETLSGARGTTERIVQIETNLDDLNPQAYETVMDRLFAAGAVDVTLTPVVMKRGRPGIVLAALAPPGKAESVSAVMLAETTALGVRLQEMSRHVLARRMVSLPLRGGHVKVKVATLDRDRTKAAPEYQDCKRIAQRTGRPVQEIMQEAMEVFHRQGISKRAKGKGQR